MNHCFFKKQQTLFIQFCLSFAFSLISFFASGQIDCSIAANCTNAECQFPATVEKGCNCKDNIDNDSDGVKDAADFDCASYYGLVFVGDGSNCSLQPPAGTGVFASISNIPIISSNNTTDTQSKITVGDVDNDGIPDAVLTSKHNSALRVVNTRTGAIKSLFNLTGNSGKAAFSFLPSGDVAKLKYEHENLIVDIDKDGIAEIFTIASLRAGSGQDNTPSRFYMLAFKYVVAEPVALYKAVDLGTNRPGVLGVADFDGDGLAEIYMRDRIYAAENGKLLASSTGNDAALNLINPAWDVDINSGPAAVNIFDDSPADANKLELVCGTKIYKVPNLNDRTGTTVKTLTITDPKYDMNSFSTAKCYVKLINDAVEYGIDTHSMTSVADMDKDGHIDVIISGALNDKFGPTTVFYWNVFKQTVSHFSPPDDTNLNGWSWGTGRINLYDVGGPKVAGVPSGPDGFLEMTFIAGNRLWCLSTNAAGQIVTPSTPNAIWSSFRTIEDSRSGVITVTIYDFNNDGKPEIVYRDSKEVVVLDYTGQTKLWSSTCLSHTYTEGPIIADVDGLNGTDICVTCSFSDNESAFKINGSLSDQAGGHFRLFYSTSNAWLPTRKVWNQQGYFVVNIKDNLQLPFPQIGMNMVFGNTNCPNGLPGPQMPLNIFLNQVPYLSAEGCPVFPAPDLSYNGDDPDDPTDDSNGDGIYRPTVEIIKPICGDLTIQARFRIINDGDLPINTTIPVSFFHGDPRVAGITSDSLLYVAQIPVINLGVGDTLLSDWTTFDGPGSAFRLYILLNNNGTTLPVNLSTSTTECRIDNNISTVFIDPDPFKTKIIKVADNEKCAEIDPDTNLPNPNSGEVRVEVYKGTILQPLSDYTIQWFTGPATSPTPIAGQNGSYMTALAEGDYSVLVTNTAKGCQGIMQDTTVLRIGNDPDVTIDLISNQTQCNPPNGALQASIVGGETGFTFTWRSAEDLSLLGITGPDAINLEAGGYILEVEKDGCIKEVVSPVIEDPDRPDAQAQVIKNVVDCLDPTSGEMTAQALIGTDVQDPAGYTFNWHLYAGGVRGTILPPDYGTGETRTGLPVGSYQVVIIDNATECEANQFPIVTITSATVIPTVDLTEVAPNTSCDDELGNGIISAVATGTGLTSPNDFTFRWFKGDNTDDQFEVFTTSGTNGFTLNEVDGGGVFYTVMATTANNCSATDKIIITEDINTPVVTLTSAPNSVCDESLGSGSYNGSITATVTFDGGTVTLPNPNYSFTWYNGGTIASPTISVADPTVASVTGLNGGNYTVVVERTDLHCVSDPDSEPVVNAPVLPAISFTPTPSTNCVGGAANGSLVANITNPTVGHTYAFQWTGISDANGGKTNTAINLAGGANYSVTATNQVTGCVNSNSTALADGKTNPTLLIAPSPNSVCDPALGYNGSVNQTAVPTDPNKIVGDTYTYVWSTGSDMTNVILGESASSLTGRNGGFYTATVKNNRLNCTSSPVTVQITNTLVLPAIVPTPTPSTNCAGAAHNGAISVTISNNAPQNHPMTFQWYTGNVVDPTKTLTAAQQGTTANAIQLDGGLNYLVRVRNSTTGCVNTLVQALADMSVAPVLKLDSVNNSICDVALNFNGQALRESITGANELGTDTYTYAWSTGSDMTQLIAGQTSSTITGRNGGFYTATATNNRLGCTSNPVTIEIKNAQILPAISPTPTASTTCAGVTPNGSVSVAITNNPTNQPMTFQWYTGNTVDPTKTLPANPNQGTTSNVIQIQGGSSYLVEVRNSTTGCKNTLVQALADMSQAPVLKLDSVNNSICDATLNYNGQVLRQAITGANELGTDTYTFAWSTGSDMTQLIAGQTASPLTGRNGGFYTGTAKNNRLGCTSNPVTIEVKNAVVLPAISSTPTPSTTCAGVTPNGSINVVVTNAAGAPMTFQWYTGNTVDPANDLPANPNQGTLANVVQIQGGASYTVEARNSLTGCKNTFTQLLADLSVAPILELDSADNSVCDAAFNYNGQAFKDVITGTNELGTDTYTYAWSTGSDMSQIIAGQTASSITGRNGGFYTATAKNNRLGCTSNPVTIEVKNVVILPLINLTPTASTNCPGGTANGEIDATIGNNGVGHAMTFQWYNGNTVASPVIPNTPNQGNTANVIQLQGGSNYTVEVRNMVTGCVNTKTQTLINNAIAPVLELDSINNSVCDATLDYTGEAMQETITDPNKLGTDTYTFAWSTGSTMAAIIAGETTSSIDELNGGFYTATVRNNRLNCTSNPVTIEVKNVLVLPDIAFNPTPSTNCATGTPNGEIEVTIANNTANHPMTYQWHVGNTTAGATVPTGVNGGNTAHIVQMQGGLNYTLFVRNETTGCESTETQTLSDISTLPVFDLTIKDNEKCVTPFDGALTIITTAPTFVDANALGTDTYTVRWYNGGAVTATPDQTNTNITKANLPTNALRSALDNGFYTVTITNNRLGCTSNAVVREVLDDLELPDIDFINEISSTNCSGGTPNGGVTATVTNVGAPATTYSWFQGNLASGTPVPPANGGLTATITGQQGGNNFTVEATFTTTGCKFSETHTIDDDSEIPVITPLLDTDNINCTAPFSGTASVAATAFTYRGQTIAAPYTGFAISWTGGATVNGVDALSLLGPGSYTFNVTAGTNNTVTNNNDNCVATPVTATVVNDFDLPDLDVEVKNQTSCNVAAPNGRLKATLATPMTNVVFDWFAGVGTTGIAGSGLTETSDGLTTPVLVANDYTVTALNTVTRCKSLATVLLSDSLYNPVITLNVLNHVTACLPPDGSVSPTVTELSPSNTNFSIFYINTYSDATNPVAAPTDATAIVNAATTAGTFEGPLTTNTPSDIDELFPGWITAVVVDNHTTCKSSPATLQLQDNTALNTINAGVITAAGFCGGGGGSMEVNVSGGVVSPAGDYNFKWYLGTPSNNNINFFLNPPNMTSATLLTNADDFLEEDNLNPPAGLGSGTYTVVITDDVGCGAYLIDNVPFAGAPTITITPTNSTQCAAPFDGSIQVDVVGAQNYGIIFYNGNTALNPALKGEISDDLVDNDGDLLVDLADPDSKGTEICGNLIAGLPVDDDGDGDIDAADSDCGNVSTTLSLLDAGEYLVRVIDYSPANRACPLDEGVVIIREGYAPVLTLEDVTPNTACDETGNSDGIVAITIEQDADDQRDAAVVAGYGYEITTVTPAPRLLPVVPQTFMGVANVNNQSLNYGFGPTSYTIRVTELQSNCFTDQVVVVPDQPKIPQLISVNVVNDSFCAPASNGSATVVDVEPDFVADYNYKWYTDPALSVASIVHNANGNAGALFNDATANTGAGYINGSTGNGIGTQTYYVRGERLPGTGDGVGCPTPAVQVVIQDTHTTPVVSLSSLANTSCLPGTGEGRIRVVATTSPAAAAVQNATYNFGITAGPSTVVGTGGHAGNPTLPTLPFTFSNLVDGSYTVRAVNEVSSCAATGVISVAPTKFNLNITNHTSLNQLICDPNGEIEVTGVQVNRATTGESTLSFTSATPLTTDFNFQWFRAPVATPGTFNPASPLQDVNVPSTIDIPLLEAGTGEDQYQTMGAGTYYVIATKKTAIGLNCSTPPLRVDISDQHKNPVITFTPFSNTACSGAFEGELDVDISDATAPGFTPYDFTYTWTLSGGTTTNPGNGTSYLGNSDPVTGDGPFTGLQEGTYTLVAENNQTGCTGTGASTIFKNTIPIFVTEFDITPQFYCDPSGKIIVTEIEYEDRNGVTQIAPLDDFTYSWSRNNAVVATTDPSAPIDAFHNGYELDSITYAGISAGVYKLIATRFQNGPGAGCPTAPITLEIEDERQNPTIVLTPFSNTSCTSDFEGEIEVNINDNSVDKVPAVPFTYSYTWTDPDGSGSATPPNQPAQSGVGDTYADLQEGQYRLSIVNNETGCVAQATTTIIKNQTPVFVQDVDMLPQFYCDPSGRLQVMSITYQDRNGVSQSPAGILNDFVYQWQREIGNVISTVGTTNGNDPGGRGTILDSLAYAGPAGTSMGAGIYYVVATRNQGTPGAGCSSAPFRIDVTDETDDPFVTLSPFSNTSCTTAFEGEIEVDVTDASVAKVPPAAFDYNYVWTDVNNTINALPPNDTNQDGANNLYTDLQEGVYKLEVTNTITGCVGQATTTIIKNQTPVFVQDVSSLPQFFCTPSGRLEVESVSFNDRNGVSTPGPIADFNFLWTRNDLTNNVGLTDGAVARGTILDSLSYNDPINFTTIGAGVYYVVAERVNGAPGAGCKSAPFRIDILDRRETPVVTLTPFSNTSCTTDFEGQIDVHVDDASVDKVPPVAFNYNYTWTDVNNTGLALPANDVAQSGVLNTYVDLKEGVYKLAVINNVTQCVGEATTTIIKNQTPVFTQAVAATPQFYCTPGGHLEVKSISYNDRDGVSQAGTLTDFNYTWTRNDLVTSVAVTIGTDPRGAFLDSLVYSSIGAGTYFVVAERVNGVPGAGCKSAPFRVDITDQSQAPVVTLTPFSNTSCTTDFEGEIEIVVNDNSAPKIVPSPDAGIPFTFDYTWNDVNASGLVLPANATNQNGSLVTYTDLEDGVYRVTVVNDMTGCVGSATTEIVKNQTPVFTQDVDAVDQFYCTPSGHLEVKSITFNDRNGTSFPGNLADFTYEWTRDDLTTIVGNTNGADPGGRGAFLDSLSYAGPAGTTIGFGTYFVVATRNAGEPGAGCKSAPFRVDIEDKRDYPVVTFDTQENTSCDNNFDGRITLTASTTTAPGAGMNYDITWVPSAGNSFTNVVDVPTPYITPITDIIGPGTFTARVTNRETLCFTDAQVTMISNPHPIEILTVNSVDQMICYADGSITVNSVSTGAPVNYTFEWFRNDPASTPLVDGGNLTITTPVLDETNYPTMGAGTYYIQATKLPSPGTGSPGSGCITPPFRVDIDDLHVNPEVALTYTPNSSCDPINPNGLVTAVAQEQNGSTVDAYTFDWTLNAGPLNGATVETPVDNHTERLDNAEDGVYIVNVTNTSNTGCQIQASINVSKDLNISLPNIIDVSTIDPTLCLPPDGSAMVTKISIGGVVSYESPADDLDVLFDYKWYKGGFDVTNENAFLVGSETNATYNGMSPDTYFVLVQDLTTLCKSTPREVVINDDDIVYPVVQIDQTVLQVSCITPGSAELQATADGFNDTNPNYSFTWFNNLTSSGISAANTSTYAQLSAGNYSVKVLNSISGCTADAFYIVPDDAPLFYPRVSISSIPRVNCLVPDGELLAREVGYDPTSGYPFPANYAAELFENPADPQNPTGTGVAMTNVPGFPLNWLEKGLDALPYTVKIIDNNTGCISFGQHTIEDGRTPPVIVVVEEHPMVNCLVDIADGQLYATADNNQVGGYSFEWYRGTTATGPILQNTYNLIGETIDTYTVRVTNDFTGCFADANGQINDARVYPPRPTATVINDREHCVDPDGIVSATVDGITFKYDFFWYDGTSVKTTEDHLGDTYIERAEGPYTVTAQDHETGCISNPATVIVEDMRVYPTITFTTTPSFCEDVPSTVNDGGTGTIELVISPQSIFTESVLWTNVETGALAGTGSFINQLYPGVYQADLTATNGCQVSGTAEVGTEILTYNLVTKNEDGKNDLFVIDCISRFPNNSVKIYNRSGVMVYEARGYNNTDTVFKGLGEKGVYTTGTELPVGTYFYVIDKGDGSKPKTGYLELVK